MNKKRTYLTDAEFRSAIEKLKKAKPAGPFIFTVKNYPLLNELIRQGRAKIENGIVILLDQNGKEATE